MAPVDWSALPEEIWQLIAKKLFFTDYHNFAGVCRIWRSLIQEIRPHPRFPWMILSDDDNNRPAPNTHPFFNLLENKICGLRVPQLRGKRCCGSSHGWLIISSENSHSIHLHNPFSGAEISLPPTVDFPRPRPRPDFNSHYFIRKVILSSDPATSSQYTVMALYDPCRLAFFKSGSDKWIHYSQPLLPYPLPDLVCSNGKFYAHTPCGKLVVVGNLEGDHPTLTKIVSDVIDRGYKPEWLPKIFQTYLVVVESSLLQVWRMFKFCKWDTQPHGAAFMVKLFKIDEKTKSREEVTSLGSDTVLFLGTNDSLSLSVKRFPGFKGNRIFFDEGRCLKNGCRMKNDLVVYDLDDRSLKPYLPSGISSSFHSPPIWILPNSP